MRQVIDDCIRFVFENELPESLAPASSKVGRTAMRIALGDLLNWLKGLASGYSEVRMPIASPTIARVMGILLREVKPLGTLFSLRQRTLSFRSGVSPDERQRIAAHVHANSRFPEDVVQSRARAR